MPIYYPDILNEHSAPAPFSYTEKDVILYALGIGMGQSSMSESELAFLYEKDLKTVATAVTVLASKVGAVPVDTDHLPVGHRSSQMNLPMTVHGEQKVELHRPLPARGSFTTEQRTIGAFDKGEGKGAVVVQEAIWRTPEGEKVATLTTTIFARGDGGFGGPATGAPEPHSVPDRQPDMSVDIATRSDQAILYRLNGDWNPLHIEPDIARAAGFPKPILHGMCTYGITCRAVMQAVTGDDSDQILSHQVRFSAPVFPGETISVDLWVDDKSVSFEARVKERDVVVIKNGLTVLR